jgi:putative transposase
LLLTRCVIWNNSEQGSHVTIPLSIDRLKPFGIEISMDGRGRALDNISSTERLRRGAKA